MKLGEIKESGAIEKAAEINCAVETKVIVVSFQNLRAGKPPYVVIYGRPQRNNEVNYFGDVVIEAARSTVLKVEGTSLLNASVDGTSCESY